VTRTDPDLVGKRVLVGLTCINSEGDVVAQFQTHGVVTKVGDDAISLTRDDGSSFGLPPAPELLDAADPGVYTLKETGESIEDPDFLASLTVTVTDLASNSEIKAHGFSAPDVGRAS
jgi:hypothetical protein